MQQHKSLRQKQYFKNVRLSVKWNLFNLLQPENVKVPNPPPL